MSVIQIKYSTVAGHVPSGLLAGQLAINITDGIIFWNNNSGVLKNFSFLNPLAPTLGASDNSTHVANTAFVQGLINAVLGSPPSSLNTLGELAAAINSDPNFYRTINNTLVNMVRFDIAQTLSGPQITQLWANLGLGSAGTIDGGTF